MHLLLASVTTPGATADSIVDSFIAAAKLLKDDDHKGESSSASTSADGTAGATASRGVLREPAIQAAFKSAKFGDLIAIRHTLDITTIDGRLKFFEAATRPGLTICSRILCYGEQALARRHVILQELHSLRNDLGAWFSFCQVADHVTNIVPTNATAWHWCGPRNDQPAQMNLFLSQQFAKMDFFNGPCGLYAAKKLLCGATKNTAHVKLLDMYCSPPLLDELTVWGGRIFVGIGVPATLEPGNTGYT